MADLLVVELTPRCHSVPTPCPCCDVCVYVPADSRGEVVDCYACGVELVTRQGAEGVAVAQRFSAEAR